MRKGVIGLDFGSLSCRGVLMDPGDGAVLAEAEWPYRHGILSVLPDGTAVPEGYVLQDPSDFREALYEVVKALLGSPGAKGAAVAAIGLDSTASTVVPVTEDLTPLCSLAPFRNHPGAYAVMWKDHRAAAEAAMLTEALRRTDAAWLDRFGGSIGAEALVSKAAHIALDMPDIYGAAYAFMEMGDWLTSLLTGRPALSRTTLACKNLYRQGTGFPGEAFFREIDSRLAGLPGKTMPWKADAMSTGCPGQSAGRVSEAAAEWLGLNDTVTVTFSQMDGYAGLVGAGVAEAGQLVLTCGTSTGFFMLSGSEGPVRGVCAAVRDSMVPGFTGIAAGQASTGDAFAWYVENALPGSYLDEAGRHGMDAHSWLCECIRRLPESAGRPLALDWMNGNKSPLNRSDLSGLILGVTLDTKPEQIYRAMMEAAAFGARRIVDGLAGQGIPVTGILANGGISRKNPMLMQIYADVLQRPVEVLDCPQAAALGSAIAAYVAEADGYARWTELVSGIRPARTAVYRPDPAKKQLYDRLYAEYLRVSDYFSNENLVMAELRALH